MEERLKLFPQILQLKLLSCRDTKTHRDVNAGLDPRSAFPGPVPARSDRSLYLRVDRSVLVQAHCVSEGFPADSAFKRPRPAVRPPYMDLQPMRSGEHL